MARMLARSRKPKLCPYGCCWSWRNYHRQAKKSNRAYEKKSWMREQVNDMSNI